MTERNANLPPNPAASPAPCPAHPSTHVDDRIFRRLLTLLFKLEGCWVRACRRNRFCSATSGRWPRCLATMPEADRATTRAEVHKVAVGARDKLGREPDPWPVKKGPFEQGPSDQGPLEQKPGDQAADDAALHRRDLDLLDIAFGFGHPVLGARVRDWVRSDPEWQRARADRCAAGRAKKRTAMQSGTGKDR